MTVALFGVFGNPLVLTTVVLILKPYSHMPITVCITYNTTSHVR